ncbi:MAG TPA: hypothetical protein VJ892_03465 [Candidatus Absconditabacterales bacterium]|nr:hypothetical protein [Candidatus Absconditabacterales bacterium]
MKKSLIILITFILILSTIGCSSQEYEVNIEVAPEGAGEVVGEGIYESGEEVEIAAFPNQGYDFSGWEIDGEIVSEDQSLKITVDESKNIKANFEELKYVTLEIKEGREVILGPFNKGDEIFLEPKEKPHYQFVSWEVDGERLSNEKKYDFVMGNKDVYIKAIYEKKIIEENKEEQEVEETQEKNNNKKIIEERIDSNITLAKEYVNNEDWKKLSETLEKLGEDGIQINDKLIRKLKENKVMGEDRFFEIVEKYEEGKPLNLNDEILLNDEKLFNWIKSYFNYYKNIQKELFDAFNGDEYVIIFDQSPNEYVHFFTNSENRLWFEGEKTLSWRVLNPNLNKSQYTKANWIDWPYGYKEIEIQDFSLGNFEDLKLIKTTQKNIYYSDTNEIFVNLKYKEDYSLENFNYDFDVPEESIGDVRIQFSVKKTDGGSYGFTRTGINFLKLAEKEGTE